MGGVSDSLVEDEGLAAARAAQKAIRDALKPRATTGRRYSIGDGDACPMGHGAMFVLDMHPKRQYCPDQSHDGVWSKEGKQPATRNLWPYHGFDEAVATYTASRAPTVLDDINMEGFDA